MRKLIILLALLAIGSLIIAAGISVGTGNKKGAGGGPAAVAHAAHMSHAVSTSTQDLPVEIDGAATPELIPDTTAYSLFFNFFSDRAESERDLLQSYCDQSELADVSLDSLLAATAYYKEKVYPIDAQANNIREAEDPLSPVALANFAALRAQREAVVNEVVAMLPEFVGAKGALAVRNHIDKRIKPRTKIIPGPMMPH